MHSKNSNFYWCTEYDPLICILFSWFWLCSCSSMYAACPVCYVPVEQAIASMPSSPSESPVLQNLTYIHDEKPVKTETHGGSDFGGYPSLKQRNGSYEIKESMTVHCG